MNRITRRVAFRVTGYASFYLSMRASDNLSKNLYGFVKLGRHVPCHPGIWAESNHSHADKTPLNKNL